MSHPIKTKTFMELYESIKNGSAEALKESSDAGFDAITAAYMKETLNVNNELAQDIATGFRSFISNFDEYLEDSGPGVLNATQDSDGMHTISLTYDAVDLKPVEQSVRTSNYRDPFEPDEANYSDVDLDVSTEFDNLTGFKAGDKLVYHIEIDLNEGSYSMDVSWGLNGIGIVLADEGFDFETDSVESVADQVHANMEDIIETLIKNKMEY